LNNVVYKIEGELGRGKFGTCYKCTNPKYTNHASKYEDETIAIKIQRTMGNKLLTVDNKPCFSDTIIQTEIDILKKINHKHIIRYIDSGVEQYSPISQFHFLATNHINGVELIYAINDHIIHEPDALLILNQLIRAIKYLHDKLILHGDIKCENMIYDNTTKQITLIDFGHSIDLSMDGNSRVNGTSGYCAPEIYINNICTDLLSDVWSFGVVAYVLVFKQLPFASNNFNLTPKYTTPHCSLYYKRFLKKCLKGHDSRANSDVIYDYLINKVEE